MYQCGVAAPALFDHQQLPLSSPYGRQRTHAYGNRCGCRVWICDWCDDSSCRRTPWCILITLHESNLSCFAGCSPNGIPLQSRREVRAAFSEADKVTARRLEPPLKSLLRQWEVVEDVVSSTCSFTALVWLSYVFDLSRVRIPKKLRQPRQMFTFGFDRSSSSARD